MKIEFKNKDLVKYLQEGGAMEAPAAEPTAAPELEQDPLMQLAAAFQQGLQNQDCQLLAQAAQAFLQLVAGAQQQAAPEGQPVYKKGGKFSRWIKK